MFLSSIDKVTNSVIHQKNKLTRKNSRKLWPFRLAIVAGQNAIAIQSAIPKIIKNIRPSFLLMIVCGLTFTYGLLFSKQVYSLRNNRDKAVLK